MHGWLRRKATRNIGRGIPHNPKPDKGKVEIPKSFDLFTFLNEESVESESVYVVVDSAGNFEVDKSYRDSGVSEGWLKPNGYYVKNDKIYWTLLYLG